MIKHFLLFISISFSLSCYAQIDFDKYEASLKLNNSALIDIKNQNYIAAIQKVERALQLDSTNRNSYINLYNSYYQLDNVEPLISHLEKAKKIFLEDDEILYYTGNIYHKLNDFKKAISNYDSAIEYSKINGEDFALVYAYYLNRGICYYKQQEYEKALDNFTQALKFKTRGSIYANRGNTYFNLNMVQEACTDWNKANELGEKTVVEKITKHCNF